MINAVIARFRWRGGEYVLMHEPVPELQCIPNALRLYREFPEAQRCYYGQGATYLDALITSLVAAAEDSLLEVRK